MSGVNLLAEVEAAGLRLAEAEGGGLSVKGPRAAVAAWEEAMRNRKAELIDALVCREERAAIEGAPEWMDARAWRRVLDSPAVRFLLSKGCEIESVTLAGSGTVEQGRAA